jgi:hypothetical protein
LKLMMITFDTEDAEGGREEEDIEEEISND